MKIYNLHGWQVDVAQAKEIQLRLAKKIVTENKELKPRLIVGVDISAANSQGIARGAAVILNYPDLEIIEVKTAEVKLDFPYIPGLLSFR
ncbi:MAG: endonuclease V, partial [Chloroflexi bacterium CG_4_9_14_3_um_filter_45_9]